jgi:hypothetical protein
MSTREILPSRRANETLSFETRDGIAVLVTVGFAPDGRIAEIFLNADRANSMLDALLSDAAIIVSIALQHGCTVRQLAHAVKRDARGLASSVLGAVLDRVAQPEEVL